MVTNSARSFQALPDVLGWYRHNGDSRFLPSRPIRHHERFPLSSHVHRSDGPPLPSSEEGRECVSPPLLCRDRCECATPPPPQSCTAKNRPTRIRSEQRRVGKECSR